MSEGQQREGLRSGGIRDALRDAEGPECGPMRCPVQRSRNRLVTTVSRWLQMVEKWETDPVNAPNPYREPAKGT